MSAYDLVKEKVPEHLQPLKEIIQKSCCFDVRDDKYSEIGFKLMLAGEGDKKALKEVSEFIQNQQRDLKRMEGYFSDFIRQIASWMYWAKFWVIRSPKSVEEKDMVFNERC